MNGRLSLLIIRLGPLRYLHLAHPLDFGPFGLDLRSVSSSAQVKKRNSSTRWKTLNSQALTDRLVPRPGVEPGLEVPETSVMSFSLPGLTNEQSS